MMRPRTLLAGAAAPHESRVIADLLSAVVEAVAQPIWVVDPEGRILVANPAAVAALGYDSADELLGRISHDTIHYKHPDGTAFPASECPMLLPRTTGETVSRDLDWFIRRDGSMFRVAYTSVPLEMGDGRGAVVAFSDIESRHRSEQALRARERALAAEQASLHRVAELAAKGAPAADVFAAVAEQVAEVLNLALVATFRSEGDETLTVMGAWSERPHPLRTGTRWPLEERSLAARVLRTARPVRADDLGAVDGAIAAATRRGGVRAGACAPIVVDDRIWGMIAASPAAEDPLPEGIEHRLAAFTTLLATAISDSEAREDLRRLADEQAALRRVATLVAEGAEPQVVFDAVCAETGRVVGASSVNLAHFEGDGSHTVAGWSLRGVHVPAGTRLALEGDSVNRRVREAAAPARIDSYADAAGPLADAVRRLGIRSEVGAPVVVEGRPWGVLIAATDEPDPLPAATERRLASFADVVATAISNAAARAELVASRARIVEAADEQRRQVVRDLHDGAQQRLVHAIVTLKLAREVLGREASAGAALVQEALAQAEQGVDELRELAHGILPAALTSGGLRTGLELLAERVSVPVTFDVPATRFAPSVEATAYFVVAESLTNVVKHARATGVSVRISAREGRLEVRVRDDGVGGARATGPGLVGMRDRLATLEGRLEIDSPPGRGTLVTAGIPL